MSMPFQQPPPIALNQQSYGSHSGSGSFGPVIAVLAVLMILGLIAGMIGRLCSGRGIMGYGEEYDLEGWFERKCSSCIDGTIDPPRTNAGVAECSVPIEIPAENSQETKQTEQSSQN